MEADERPTKRCQFRPGIDLSAALTGLGIESLDVSRERAIAVDGRSILDFVVVEGSLSDARTVEIGVIDHPSNASETPTTYLETAIARLERATAPGDREPTADSSLNLP